MLFATGSVSAATVTTTHSKTPIKHTQTLHHHAKNKTHKSRHHLAHAKHHNARHIVKLSLNNVPAYYNKAPVVDPSVSYVSMPGESQKHLLSYVHKAVSTLRYSDYKLGGKRFDPARGIYVVDCSNFVDHILQATTPQAYSSLVNATGSGMPSTQHYYNFFNELANDPDSSWNKINSVGELRAGDILVFRYKNLHGDESGGHVMVVMETPVGGSNVYSVRVADSAPSRHSSDTRQIHEGGIGIGTLMLRINPVTGKPSAYAWGLGGYWNKNVNFAMARPIELPISPA
jgi:hypothetical protein